ncbi:MAG: peptidylprolyl isomerase [Flavobacteriales bacterium]|nr:peptidylprolyl isomerase [Flavobacteriales bacterium]
MRNKLIFSLTLLLSMTSFAQQEGVVIDKVLAVVGENVILKSDIEAQVVSMRANGVLVDDDARCNLFEELLFQKLLLHQAALDSVTVTEEEVEAEINRRLNYFIAQVGSERKLEQYYKKSISQIKDEFRKIVKEQMISQRMQGQITGSVKVTPKEVKTYYNSIHPDSIPTIESEVEYAQILINAKVSEASKLEAYERIEGLRQRIMNGEEFSTLAILYSEDEGSAKKGGELGFLGRAELVTEFSVVAFKLKNQAVSEIVETEFGYHIMQLIERRGQKVNVRHILVKPKVDEVEVQKAKNLADSVYQLLGVDSIKFEQMAEKFSDDKSTKKNGGLAVNPQTATSVFYIDQVNPQIYYTIEKMKPGETSAPVPAQDTNGKKGYRIIKLITKSEPHKATLDSDYDKVQAAALVDKQNKTTMEWVKKKAKNTYVKIDPEYMECSFDNDWTN